MGHPAEQAAVDSSETSQSASGGMGHRVIADRYHLDEGHVAFNFRYEMRMYRQLSSAVRFLKMLQAGWEPEGELDGG